MEITVLGCGTSQGVPLVAHDNPGWDRGEPRNWRTRSSVHVVIEGHHVQVDCGPDFRSQCLSCHIREVDTVILTHGHADHVLGMDDLRQFCTNRGGASIPIYGTDEGLGRVRTIFPYALGRPVASGYVSLDPRLMPEKLVLPGGGIVRSTLLPHGVDVLGLVFEEPSTGTRFAYYTDCKRVPAAARELARDVDLALLDGLRPEWHPTHMTVDEACEVAADLRARQAYLTHMTFQVDYATYSRRLATAHPRVALAYDGLRVRLGEPA